MIAALRRRLRGTDETAENGVSLTELIVTMFVTGIVLAIVGNMFINVAKVTTNSSNATTRTSIAANVMNEATKVIRLAVTNAVSTSEIPDAAIISGTASALTLYSYVDTSATSPAPTKVAFRLDASGNVVEDRWAGALSSGYWVYTGAVSSRTIGGPVTSTAADPMFTYYTSTGDVVTPAATGLTAAERASIASITVTVRLENQGTTGSDPIILVNKVAMTNLKLAGNDS